MSQSISIASIQVQGKAMLKTLNEMIASTEEIVRSQLSFINNPNLPTEVRENTRFELDEMISGIECRLEETRRNNRVLTGQIYSLSSSAMANGGDPDNIRQFANSMYQEVDSWTAEMRAADRRMTSLRNELHA